MAALQGGSEAAEQEAARAAAAEERCRELDANVAAVTERLQEAVAALQVRCWPVATCPGLACGLICMHGICPPTWTCQSSLTV